MKWISVEKELPPSGMEYSFLITDGEHIGIGYYEEEYFAEDPTELLQYSSAVWHDDGSALKTSLGGWVKPTHWMELPDLPTASQNPHPERIEED